MSESVPVPGVSTPPTLDLRVNTMSFEAEGVLSVTLADPARRALPEWSPGAHLSVHLPDGLVRQYSLCGDPADSSLYRIAVLFEREGRGGSMFVHTQLRVGDTVTVSVPRNHFVLEDAGSYLFVAGGIGITPMLPMLGEAQRRGRPWRLHYYGRRVETMAFVDELAAHGDAVVLESSADGAASVEDVVTELNDDGLLYVCGPARLSGAVDEVAERGGFADRLRQERFIAPIVADEDAEPRDSFVVRLETSGLELTVPAEKSILDVVLEAGIPVMHDCAEGICGTCETAVVGGAPDHRDYVLTNQEKEANDCMMICVSRSQCPVLTLAL